MKTPYNVQLKKILQKFYPDIVWDKNDTICITDTHIEIPNMDNDLYFNIQEFPGCCGIAVVCDTESTTNFHYGCFPIFLKIWMKQAYNLDYRQLMLADTNPAIWAAAEQVGFSKTSEFINKKTNNRICSYTITLHKDSTPLNA